MRPILYKVAISIFGGFFVTTLHAQQVYDRFGNTYTLDQIEMPPPAQFLGGGGACAQAGIFNLSYAAGSSFSLAAQQVVCQVFSDLSELIEPANNPYTGAANTAPYVNILIVDFALLGAPSNAVAGASPIFSWLDTPQDEPQLHSIHDDYRPLTLMNGVLDGQVWKAINGGFDPWFCARVFKVGNTPQTFAHGVLAVNWSAPDPWYMEATLPVPAGERDLYTVIAHEALHMLGFGSAMNMNLQSLIGNTHYAFRFDTHLSQAGNRLIFDPVLCDGTDWGTNFNSAFNTEPGNCSIEYSGTWTTPSMPIYGPFPFESGSSLSHINGACTSNAVLMHPNDDYASVQSRVPLQTEVNMLCDIDYRTRDHYGASSSGWDGTFLTRTPCGSRLAGVDDIWSDYPSKTYYYVQQGGTITIDNFLDNDEDMTTVSGHPEAFDCLEVLEGGTITAQFNFPDPNPRFVMDMDAGFVGWARVSYRPRNSADGRTGNITNIYIHVWPSSACTNADCNILNGGDFESVAFRNGNVAPHDSYTEGTVNSPDLFAFEPSGFPLSSIGPRPPGWYDFNSLTSPASFFSLCGGIGEADPASWNGASVNMRYAQVACIPSQANTSREGLVFETCKPLIPGYTYTIEYRAKNGGFCASEWSFYAFQDRPCNPTQGITSFTGPNPCGGAPPPYLFPLPASPLTNTWVSISNTFVYSAGFQSDYVVARSPVPSAISFLLIDDLVLRPVITADASITPSCNGQSNGSITLDVHYYNGEYDIQWSTGGTTANLSNLAPGDYTVTISDNTLGCASFTQTYTVGNASCSGPFTLTKAVTPPSGNTYAGAPVMFTIQACNNDVADQVVNITDEMPAGFVPAFNSPNNPYWPTASVTIPAGECITTEITGYFTQIGPHTNTVTLEQVPGISLSADATITLLQGCPMLVYGSGGCLPGAAVNLCLGMHTQLTNVESVDYYIVYPDFLEPPAPGSILGNISSPFGISAATIGTPAPLAWPSGPGYGYATVPVHVAFTAPVSASPPYSFFCVGFQVGSAGLPLGVNAVWTWASTTPSVSGWNRVTVNMTGGSTDLWTQAYHILFTGCPGINGPNANFTAQTSSCGGAVTVSAELTDPDAIHIWTWGDERTTPTNGAPGWTYDYFGPITDNQGWPVNIPPAAPGTYTITHTVILDGVATNSTQAVTIHACCAAALSIPHGTLSSTLPSTISGTVDIQGQFIIDQNLSLNGVQVTMEPGAEITVQPGRFLVVRDSELGSCNGTMWKGITVNSGSYLEMQRNTVKDAEYAVTALDGATVLLFNNDITDNRVGLYVPNTLGVPFNSVSAHVVGNRFNSTGTLALPYPGQTTAMGNVGFAAVLAWKTALDLTGYPGYSNTVDGMSNGILAFSSDLSVARFNFRNVQPDGAYSVPNDANGSGIHGYGQKGAHYLRQTGNGKQGLPSFQNCRRGIYTLRMNTDSRDNNMQGVGTAYRVDKARKTTEITNNKVAAKLNGMEFNQNAGTLRFWVTGNDITFGTLAELVPAPLCNGILVADGNSGGQDSRIEGNTISMLSLPLARTGINLLAARKWTVAGNSIVMGNNSLNRYGIANYGSSGLLVSCNTVTGAGTNYVQGQAAIYSNMGEKLLFGCNNVDLTTNGMLFNGVAYDVDVRGNSIRRHKFGMHLSGNAIIGTQDLKGNLWHNPPAQGGFGAWYEPIIQGQDNPNASLNPFTYNPAIINLGNTEPPSWSPNQWFNYATGTNYDCTHDGGSNYCGQFHVAKLGGGLTDLDGLVAKDSLRNDPYTEESQWMLKDGLYKKLDDDPDLRGERPDMAGFYAAMQGTATAAFKAIDDGRPTLYNMDSTVVAQLQANNDEITALMDSVKLRMALLEDNNLSEAQRAALLAGMLGFREGIRTLATWNTTAMQVAMDSKVLTAEGLKVANSIIGTTELTETNRKVVDGIYLSTIGKEIDTFTVAQSTDLFSIANQCPMLGGNAVYTARALYRLIDETFAFDDQLLCLPHGILVKRLVATEENGVAVVPNPARDNATLVLGQPLEWAGMLLVHDLAGKEVLRVDLTEGEPRTVFSTGSLASGLYQYRVESKGAVVGHGKLAISR